MEFKYEGYYVRYILNPSDFILRLEDKTGKLFEETFFERDFAHYASIGGIEFVSKLIVEALEQKNESVKIRSCVQEGKIIDLYIQYNMPFSPKRVDIPLRLVQKRRNSASEDMLDISRKLKKIFDAEIITDYTVLSLNVKSNGHNVYTLTNAKPKIPDNHPFMGLVKEFNTFKQNVCDLSKDGFVLYESSYNDSISELSIAFTFVKNGKERYIQDIYYYNIHSTEQKEEMLLYLKSGWTLFGGNVKGMQFIVKY